jgi:predicted regulator of Ras-like GTPase activity (Roadblock/LC7/MglB family)
MDQHLESLLNYEGVLGALATTRDGLVIAAVGLSGEDADIVAAAGSALLGTMDDEDSASGSMEIAGAAVHLVPGTEMSLVLLTEANVPREAVEEIMDETLSNVTAAMY